MTDTINVTSRALASAVFNAPSLMDESLAIGFYSVELVRDGRVIWTHEFPNLVTTQGRNYILDTVLAGSAYTAAWYVQPFTAGTPNAADTYASQASGSMTQATVLAARPAITFTAASAGTKASNTCAVVFNGSATITGLMLVSGGSGITTPNNTAATGGILLSEGTISPSRAVISGDTLNVSYSLTV